MCLERKLEKGLPRIYAHDIKPIRPTNRPQSLIPLAASKPIAKVNSLEYDTCNPLILGSLNSSLNLTNLA